MAKKESPIPAGMSSHPIFPIRLITAIISLLKSLLFCSKICLLCGGENMFFRSPTPSARRFLYLFARPRPELIIANNSGIFFTLASLKMHGSRFHPNVHLVMPEFWLDKAHIDHDSLHWGQTPRGLPWYVRQEFLEIYPNHKENELIRWGQFKELRKHAVQELEKNGVSIYHGTPNLTKNNSGYLVTPKNGDSFSIPSNTFIYNSFREPDLEHSLSGIASAPSHTRLYTMCAESVPNSIILIGSGRSAIWAAQHFKQSIISCIKRENSRLPLFENESRPSNLIEFPVEKFKPRGDQFEIVPADFYEPGNGASNTSAAILDLNMGLNISGHVYCAIGLKPNHNITNCVNSENLLTFPTERLQWSGSEETPLGSLMEATQRWAAATDNLSWAYETYCHHESNFVDLFTKKLEEVGVILPYKFFDVLRDKTLLMQKTDPTLNKMPLRSPSSEQVISLFKDAYSSTFENETSNAVLKTLEEELTKIDQERIQQYNDATNINPFKKV